MIALETLKTALTEELRGNILPFWSENMRSVYNDGFYGRMKGDGTLAPDANRGAVMYARILWTFSAAYHMFGDKAYLAVAKIAKKWLLGDFYDHTFGGIYWEIDASGRAVDTKKQFYALGFAIYGLSEYYRAAGDEKALEYAFKLFESIEKHSFDPIHNGYIEAATREWGEIGDLRLSTKDANERKTMNTHLHILEAYTSLHRVWKNEIVAERLRNLIDIFVDKIYSPHTGHLGLFFDDEWNDKSAGTFSYGHDIEASWLILEAALELGDNRLTERVKPICKHIAEAAMEGYQTDGSMIYEKHANGEVDADRHWWVQAETVVGLMWLWKFHGCEKASEQAVATWGYIKNHLIDYEKGEWFWSIYKDGTANRTDDKAGFWKCPYHNSRMCMEVISMI